MNHLKQLAVLCAAAIAAVAIASCGGGDTTTQAGTTPSAEEAGTASEADSEARSGGEADSVPKIVVENGEPVGGIRELEYGVGDRIEFEVESDVGDEVHVHGYDLIKDVPAGGSISYSFPAEIEGIFEVELEGRKEQIAELRVNP